MDLYITTFRYVTKGGEGKGKTFYRSLPRTEEELERNLYRGRRIKRAVKVKVVKHWSDGGRGGFYRAVPADSFLANYLKEHAHPHNPEVYFSHRAIYDRA